MRLQHPNVGSASPSALGVNLHRLGTAPGFSDCGQGPLLRGNHWSWDFDVVLLDALYSQLCAPP